ncbi:MAG: methylenetetrahydrofolate--tRNA-(uracil(54)-C(5))-methyltransferase (FADH(2)-oxidizing) TrmFO [Deltaproteobacteria bacterium]|nr:methylenetetrahydrofolate--tRNA-(uracil(54)-C(5))-methyltransferase (FADH(2)-oxidizing) TrmFO [Deltaproteobacteria bacterium]
MRVSGLTVIGGGLAGCEAVWQAARRGVSVTLYEMKPAHFSPAHHLPDLAELVCSNSLKSEAPDTAAGLLKAEMRRLDSLVLRAAAEARVPAAEALAVDRERFARTVTAAVEALPGVTVRREEVTALPPDGLVIVATGPLTSDPLAQALRELLGKDYLYFYDAISPIVEADSIAEDVVYRGSRYEDGAGDYLNCPLTERDYESFVAALLGAEKVPLHPFERIPYFEGCLPIEVMAERGRDTLAYGPMRPVGLVDPRTGKEPHAVVQLRQEDAAATLYNIVGFQTKLTWPEQRRVFRMIPGLQEARFARLGSVHRNTYVNAPLLLTPTLQLRRLPRLFIAGQLCGVEGYTESAAMGLLAGINAARLWHGQPPVVPPPTTMLGALLAYLTTPSPRGFQPMNAAFGLLAPLPGRAPRRLRRQQYAARAEQAVESWQAAAGL